MASYDEYEQEPAGLLLESASLNTVYNDQEVLEVSKPQRENLNPLNDEHLKSEADPSDAILSHDPSIMSHHPVESNDTCRDVDLPSTARSSGDRTALSGPSMMPKTVRGTMTEPGRGISLRPRASDHVPVSKQSSNNGTVLSRDTLPSSIEHDLGNLEDKSVGQDKPDVSDRSHRGTPAFAETLDERVIRKASTQKVNPLSVPEISGQHSGGNQLANNISSPVTLEYVPESFMKLDHPEKVTGHREDTTVDKLTDLYKSEFDFTPSTPEVGRWAIPTDLHSLTHEKKIPQSKNRSDYLRELQTLSPDSFSGLSLQEQNDLLCHETLTLEQSDPKMADMAAAQSTPSLDEVEKKPTTLPAEVMRRIGHLSPNMHEIACKILRKDPDLVIQHDVMFQIVIEICNIPPPLVTHDFDSVYLMFKNAVDDQMRFKSIPEEGNPQAQKENRTSQSLEDLEMFGEQEEALRINSILSQLRLQAECPDSDFKPIGSGKTPDQPENAMLSPKMRHEGPPTKVEIGTGSQPKTGQASMVTKSEEPSSSSNSNSGKVQVKAEEQCTLNLEPHPELNQQLVEELRRQNDRLTRQNQQLMRQFKGQRVGSTTTEPIPLAKQQAPKSALGITVDEPEPFPPMVVKSPTLQRMTEHHEHLSNHPPYEHSPNRTRPEMKPMDLEEMNHTTSESHDTMLRTMTESDIVSPVAQPEDMTPLNGYDSVMNELELQRMKYPVTSLNRPSSNLDHANVTSRYFKAYNLSHHQETDSLSDALPSWLPVSTEMKDNCNYSTLALYYTYEKFMGPTASNADRKIFMTSLKNAKMLFRSLDSGMYQKRGFEVMKTPDRAKLEQIEKQFVTALEQTSLKSMLEGTLNASENLASLCFSQQSDNLYLLLGHQQFLKHISGSGSLLFTDNGMALDTGQKLPSLASPLEITLQDSQSDDSLRKMMNRISLENPSEYMDSNNLLVLKNVIGSTALIKLASDSDLIRALVRIQQFHKITRIVSEKVVQTMVEKAPNNRLKQFWVSIQAMLRYPLDLSSIPIKTSFSVMGVELLATAVATNKTPFQVDDSLQKIPCAFINFLRINGSFSSVEHSRFRQKIDRIEGWVRTVSPNNLEELREMMVTLMHAFEKHAESLQGYESAACCRVLVGIHKYFSTNQQSFGLLQLKLKLRGLTNQALKWLHSNQNLDVTLKDDSNNELSNPIMHVCDLIHDEEFDIFVQVDQDVRNTLKTIPCPIDGHASTKIEKNGKSDERKHYEKPPPWRPPKDRPKPPVHAAVAITPQNSGGGQKQGAPGPNKSRYRSKFITVDEQNPKIKQSLEAIRTTQLCWKVTISAWRRPWYQTSITCRYQLIEWS